MTDQTYCSECNGGWANPIHGPGDPLTGHHEFQYTRHEAAPLDERYRALVEAARRYRLAEWANHIAQDQGETMDESNARVDEWRAADAALAALIGERLPYPVLGGPR